MVTERTKDRPLLSVVIPVYNNAPCLEELASRLERTLSTPPFEPYEVIFVNDGSADESLEILRRLSRRDQQIKVINLSRNFGHQQAITAGFDVARGDAVLVMDGDLQDPPEVIPQFVQKWREGYDVVYGTRISQSGEPPLKRWASKAFYRLLKRLSSTDIALDAGDFRLLSRRAVQTINQMRERSRFVRGMVSWIGLPQASLPYHRAARWSGESQYSLRRRLRLALDGIVAFSDIPLRVATWLGFAGAAVCLAYLAFALFVKLVWGVAAPGWVSIIAVIVFIGSIQLIVLGVMGEYMGRIYEELKGRPLYVVQDRIGFGDEERSSA